MSEEISDDPIERLQALVLEGRPAARASLSAVRDARATGPGPETEALRSAYLDLLKLSLCDLAGTTTMSVGSLPDGRTASRVLRGDQLRLRSAGLDWPLQGLTMTGLQRLDDLQACVEAVVADGVEGALIEAGAWRGGASILMRATLDSLGDADREVWVADSFEGFPKAGAEDKDLSGFAFLAVPLDEVKESFARFGCDRGVRFVPGFFEETLPGLIAGRWAIVRLDGDTYDATWTALQSLYPGLSPGGYLIVDDYGALEECRRAVDEFRSHNGITEPLEEVDWTCKRWRRESQASIEPPPPGVSPAIGEDLADANAVERSPERTIPTVRELQLTRELAEARQRLGAAEAEIARLRTSPVRAAVGRLLRPRGG